MNYLIATTILDDGIKGLLLSGGLAVTIVLLLLVGLWTKFLEPLVRKTVEAWYNDPERQNHRKAFVKEVIDDQVQRVDGVIHLHTQKHTDATNVAWQTEYKALREDMAEDRKLLHEMIQKLGRLEGMVAMIAKHNRISVPEMPAITPPPASIVQKR